MNNKCLLYIEVKKAEKTVQCPHTRETMAVGIKLLQVPYSCATTSIKNRPMITSFSPQYSGGNTHYK